jgi:iron complex transport system ATP-binding protein
MSIMQLHDVSFAYHGTHRAVDAVTAEVQPGEVHALIGPNAAGKSTLLRLMLGHLTPSAGRLTLDDHSVHELPAAKRAAWISYVPQRAAGAFAFSAGQVIAMGRFALANDEGAVARAVKACDVGELLARPFDELSVGQQQRVLLARAMAQAAGQGRVMLLDEPTSAMDMAHVHRTMGLVRKAAAGGLAVVIVLHDVNLAARYADRVWLMHEGRLAAAGPWGEVMTVERLEPVYGLKLEVRMDAADGRPRFDAVGIGDC